MGQDILHNVVKLLKMAYEILQHIIIIITIILTAWVLLFPAQSVLSLT